MAQHNAVVTGTRGPYGFRFCLDENNWLSLASWNHVHDAALEILPSENVEIGLSANRVVTYWRIDCKDVGMLLMVWQGGDTVKTIDFLEQHGEQI